MSHDIAILVPCFNEEKNVEPLLDRLLHTTSGCEGYRFSFVFVDDGSTDATIETIRGIAVRRAVENVLIIELSRNFGKEAALTAGLDAVECDACIILDADLQDPPEVIPELLMRWRQGFEVVATRRQHRPVDSALKKLGTWGFYRITNLLSDIEIPANVGDGRLLDRLVIEALRRLPENRRFMKGLFAWVGFRTALLDVSRPARHKGSSAWSTLRLISFAIDGITAFSPILVRLWAFLGLIISIYAFFHGLYIIGRVLVKGIELPGYASVAVLILFLSGIQMIGLGLIGEYVGRTYQEAKRRPAYIVRRMHRVGTDS